MGSPMPYDALPDPIDKFQLGEIIGQGFSAKVFKAQDLQNNKTVAIKVQPYDEDHIKAIEEEYRILRDHSSYPNLPDFYGAYRRKRKNDPDEVWFVLQYCEGDTAVSLVNKLKKANRTMKEEHIAFILRETAKACLELHRNHFIHRDIRGSNILLTKEGEIKLCDFGLTREVESTFGKCGTCIGSACWMAPEVVTAQNIRNPEIYGSRADVWSLGITAIELGDGQPPFFDMHPTRAMFQIVRNPPPTLFKPSNWTQEYNDFITECLEKNHENRPLMLEIIEHPFLLELPENEFALQQEIRHLIEVASGQTYEKPIEVSVDRECMKTYDCKPEKMYIEDLAALEHATDALVLDNLENRLRQGHSYSFIGDILLALNSNDLPKEFPSEIHEKYKFKSRSENAPHIFSVADLAYQDMMHHKEPQHIIFAGETYSGKTTNVNLLAKHLFFLGGGNKGATDRVEKSMKAISIMANAGTPLNNNSTRCIIEHKLTFGSTGKLSGAIFSIHMLEKTRVSTTDMNQHNFHLFYFFYDFMNANDLLNDYHLDSGRNYRYLRIPTEEQQSKLKYYRDDAINNPDRFKEFEAILLDMNLSQSNLESIRRILAAILNLGNVRFKQDSTRFAEIEDTEVVNRVAEMLKVDWKKFQWSLVNYCKVKGGIAERKQYTTEEARDARDALAAAIYQRLVDWTINKINQNLSFPRSVFGDCNSIIIHDMFGFECFHRNNLEQLMVNTINEQLQYHYNQKIFASEMFELEMDGVPLVSLDYFDNKQTLDHLLTKPEGLFVLIDDITRNQQDHEHIIEKVITKRSQFIKKQSATEISIAHYTGKIVYDIRCFIDTNKDFLPAEMVEAMRTSLDENVQLMFTNQLSKCGNLTMALDGSETKTENKKHPEMNTLSQGQYSQLNQMRTLSTVFRAVCLQLLRTLTSGSESSGSHFVRCVRADLLYKPRNFHADMVQQQIRALAVLDTIIARQQGYSNRITFQEFLTRYQFLAFDFDENVDVTKDNCRLLLLRLKMEGWAIGKTKVFLRYYNDEFLSRLYETQVKKIIKVQSMMRSYIARRRVKGKSPNEIKSTLAFRGFQARQKYGPLLNEKGIIDQTTAAFVRVYVQKWRARSLFQVILHYRAARFLDLVNMSQQVHLYNQRMVAALNQTIRSLRLEQIDAHDTNPANLGPVPLPIRKIPFRLDEIPYFDTSYMCDPVSPLANNPGASINTDVEEEWDAPMQRAPSMTNYLLTYNAFKREQSCQTNWDRLNESDIVSNQAYRRDPKGIQDNRFSNYNDRQVKGSFTTNNDRSKFNNSRLDSRGESRHDFQGGFSSNSGSRRNSLYKKRTAPTPPPMSGIRSNDISWSGRQQHQQQPVNRNDFRPANPVRELQMMAKSAGAQNDADDAPFNFKAMLRKTNYSRPQDNSNDYNRDVDRSNRVPIITGTYGDRNSNNDRFGRKSSVDKNDNYNGRPSSGFSNASDVSSNTGKYIEEEIAPGVTLKGYAFDI